MKSEPMDIGTLLIGGLVLLVMLTFFPNLLTLLLWAIIFFVIYVCLKKDKNEK